jgi:hypothetical protein
VGAIAVPEIAFGTAYYGKGFRVEFTLDAGATEPAGWAAWQLFVVAGKVGETRVITKATADLDVNGTTKVVGCDFTAADCVALGVGEWDVQLDAPENEGDELGWVKVSIIDVVR